jgi:large subunit ribosomal protein L18
MKLIGRKRRHIRIKKKIRGTPDRPRLCVFRSNRHIAALIIDDTKQKVLFSFSSLSDKKLGKMKKIEAAKEVGQRIGKIAIEKGITQVAFDRAGYLYHGRIKALADAARETGLKF